MRSRIMIGSVLAVITVAGVAFAAAAADSRAPITTAQTLRFKQKTTAVYQNDVAPMGSSIGDQVTSHSNVRKNGKVVGHTGGTCTFTGAQAICSGVIRLNGGQIAIAGQITGSFLSGTGTARFAVTGGTGAYQHVGGYATIGQNGTALQDLTITLLP